MTSPRFPDYWDWLAQRPDCLRDMRRRLWWGYEEGQTLHDALADFTGSNPHGTFVDFAGTRWHVSFHRLIAERAEWDHFERFTRLLGVYLDDIRASLNYLAVALGRLAIAVNPTLVDPALPWRQRLHPEALEFPIFAGRAKW